MGWVIQFILIVFLSSCLGAEKSGTASRTSTQGGSTSGTPPPPPPPPSSNNTGGPTDIDLDFLPEDRMPLPGTWESAGVEGGIPVRETICAQVSSVSALQSAINNCPAGQVVKLLPGTYNISSTIWIQRGITLRGSGSSTVIVASSAIPIRAGSLGPWPPPKANPEYIRPIVGGATRGSTTVSVTNASSLFQVGRMVLVDELDDQSLIHTRSGARNRSRGSFHMVEEVTSNSVSFRPALPITYSRSPQISHHPYILQNVGIENIKFVGSGSSLSSFIQFEAIWNGWISGCEFSGMPQKTIVITWSAHIEIRKNFLHDQSNGGSNSEAIDLLCDVNWSLIVDNTCVAAGFPQIVIGDGGASPYYSGGFGNVIAYNYAVDSFYTDPPTSTDHWIMTHDISTNHSPHSQYNLVEGNYMSKFGSDGYHGSGSHTVLLRNVATGRNRWQHAINRVAVQIDKRNLFYSLVGNVFGEVGSTTTHEFAETSGWSGSTIFRLGFPDIGNNGFSGLYPSTVASYPAGDGGPRDQYVDATSKTYGTTLIEGNWTSKTGLKWSTMAAQDIPESFYLSGRPTWFGSLPWPPVDPMDPETDNPAIIPAGYRYLYGRDP